MHAEDAERAELAGELPGGQFPALEPAGDVRAQPLVREAAHGGAHVALLVAQQPVNREELERGERALRGAPAVHSREA